MPPLERCHRLHRRLIQALGRDADAVFYPFRVGERDLAGANGHANNSIGEGKENAGKDHGHLDLIGDHR